MHQRATKPEPPANTEVAVRGRDPSGEHDHVMPVEGLLSEHLAVRRHGTSAQDPLGGTPVDTAVSAALRRRSGGGEPLPDALAGPMGQHLGMDLSALRVHADAEAGEIAQSVQARAFTHGNDLYFAPGQYQPWESRGQRVLAHEVSHVAAQRSGQDHSTPGGLTVGRADDPVERAADQSADRMVSALRRSTDGAVVSPARTLGNGAELRRISWPKFFSRGKKGRKNKDGGGQAGADAAQAPVPAPAQPQESLPGQESAPAPRSAWQQGTVGDGPHAGSVRLSGVRPPTRDGFAEALTDQAPANADEARGRMRDLRIMLGKMSAAERARIAQDGQLMDRARVHVGDFEYMTLVAAVGMFVPPSQARMQAGGAAVHMSGGEADQFIRQEMGTINHLSGFIDTAVAAGKQAEGYVAVVGDQDWARVYNKQYESSGKQAGVSDTLTNAFIANKHSDRPAIINHDKGTRSTAIHESMHRYSELAVLHTYGSPLNEGITEYFTRLITDKDGNPVHGQPSNRRNYQRNWTFICAMLGMLGSNLISQQTELAKIYFSGQIDLLKMHFESRCRAAGLADDLIDTRWSTFAGKIASGSWNEAVANLPPPPATPSQPAPAPAQPAPAPSPQVSSSANPPALSAPVSG